MPHGPGRGRRRPVAGPWPEGEQYDAAAAGRGRPAQRRGPVPLLDDRGDRRRPRHPAARLPRRDRELAARLQHRHDRPHRQRVPRRARCTSSGNRRWNRRGAMVTDRYQHVRHHPTVAELAAYLHERRACRCSASTTCPGSRPLETTELPRRVCLLFGQEGPGLSDAGPRGVRRHASRSRSSARPGRSTPPRPPRSRCTPGCAGTPTWTAPGAAEPGAGQMERQRSVRAGRRCR